MNMNKILSVITTFFVCLVLGEDPSIIIIGAGPAGIAAATYLLSNNFTNVKILEAESRIGGRIHSVDFGKGKIDLGAQWCHGQENNIVYEYVKNLDLLESTVYDTQIYHSSQYVDKAFSEELNELFFKINKDMEKNAKRTETMGEYFSKQYNQTILNKYGADNQKLKMARDTLENFHLVELGIEGAMSWYDCVGVSDYEECAGDPTLNWKDKGYRIFLDVLTKNYPDKSQRIPVYDKVSFNKEVSRIEWNSSSTTGNVIVTCSDDSVHQADHVIFTPSLGVLKEKAKILFHPSLPQAKRTAIEKIGFGSVFKMFVLYPETWWTHIDGFQFVWDPKDMEDAKNQFSEGPQLNGRSWITYLYAGNVIEADPNLLHMWLTGRLVPEVEIMPEEVLLKGIDFVLNKFLGHLYNITKPQKIMRTKWFNNPHFNGTYSFQTPDSNTEGSAYVKALAAPLVNSEGIPIVHFAGEATSPQHYSTVHGAVETGFREAKLLAEQYK